MEIKHILKYKNKHSVRNLSTKLAVAAGIVLLAVLCSTAIQPKAAQQMLEVKEIDYNESTITLYSPGNDTTAYFSDSSKKVWEMIPGGFSSDGTITLNISWVSVSANYTITFKGNKSEEVLTVKLPKQVTNFKASFLMAKGTMSFTNTSGRTIEWRKNGSTTWNEVNTETISSELEYLYGNGATVYFRLAPVNGDVDGVGMRPSKEVAVKITKKSAAPSVSINGSKFCIDSVSGLIYRYLYEDGTTSEWYTPDSSSLKLSDVAPAALYNKNTTQTEVSIQFKKKATSSTQVSYISTVTVPVQKEAPDVDKEGISLLYTSSSTLELKVKAASSSIPYEYTVVEEDDTLDYLTAVWSTITSSTAVSLDSDDISEGSRLYLRRKSRGTGDDFLLASAELNLTGTAGAVYPDATKIDQLTILTTVAGICNSGNSDGNLIFTVYSAYKTTVESITFCDAYGITKGTASCSSTVAKNTFSVGNEDAYIITTKITSTQNLDNVTDEVLYAKLTLANTDTIESTKDSGVCLYIYPASIINNPEDDEYTASFERIIGSDDSADENKFSFVIEYGTETVIKTADYSSLTDVEVGIETIDYGNYRLVKGTDYSVVSGSAISGEGEAVRTDTITVYVDRFELNSEIKDFNQYIYFVITLNNGEILEDEISMKLTRTAELCEAPLAWSILEGSLAETKTISTTNSDGSTSSETVEVVTYELTLELYSEDYSAGISNVTWGGYSILKSATVSKGIISIKLSNPKINKLSTDSTTTNNLIFTLSNGYVINTGCKLTILNAD